MNKLRTEKTKLSRLEEVNELWIVYVGTFPPRECGLATFTQDITKAMDELLMPAVKSKVVAMNIDDVERYHYPREVIFQINQGRVSDYIEVAEKINKNEKIKIINIQHEFGIFGGEYGLNLIPFLKTLTKPVVITFHSVLPNPDEKLYKTVKLLSENVDGIMVMTRYSKNILCDQYKIAEEKIKVIPHGIHPRSYGSSRQAKAALGFSDKIVLSTFGLLNRGKGLEYVIEALPEVVKKFPGIVYIIFGITHPNILKQEGESYRNFLIQKVYDLGLANHVKFYNRYFSVDELLQFLKATDIYLSTSLNPNQSVSGTLSYALGTGRPVVSTSFIQAKEDVTDEVGILVDFKNPKAYADAMDRLLENEVLRQQLGKNAYYKTRKMTWPNIAIEYLKLFSKYAPEFSGISEQKSLPKINLDHLAHLTDDFGILQFAKLTNPDFSSGYTLDDNARALVVAGLCYEKIEATLKNGAAAKQRKDLVTLINTYLNFILFVSKANGYFENYVNFDKTLNDDLNQKDSLEDANGRALYALAFISTRDSIPNNVKEKAFGLLENKIGNNISFSSPRAIAFYIKGLCALRTKQIKMENIDLDKILRKYCDKLVSYYQESSSPDWQWFERYLTYSNGVLPEALILGYQITGEKEYYDISKKTLEYLIKESFIKGIYVPIGQDGWRHQNGQRHHYDQQPEEVLAVIGALKSFYLITKDKYYKELMHKVFCWFLGDNNLNQMVYDRTTGGCYDGVGEKNINLNQGAESTISYLLARLSF